MAQIQVGSPEALSQGLSDSQTFVNSITQTRGHLFFWTREQSESQWLLFQHTVCGQRGGTGPFVPFLGYEGSPKPSQGRVQLQGLAGPPEKPTVSTQPVSAAQIPKANLLKRLVYHSS